MTTDMFPAPARSAPPAPQPDSQSALALEIDLGATDVAPADLVKVREQDVVPLDKSADDPVDLLIDGRVVARGHLVLLDDIVCVRVSEILHDDIRTTAHAHELK